MSLNRTAGMRFPLLRKIGRMGFLNGVVSSKVCAFTINFYLGLPSLPVASLFHAERTGRRTLSSFSKVLHIYALSYISEVHPSIVTAVTVYMVDFIGRPCARNPKKCHSMGEIDVLVYPNTNIPSVIFRACLCTPALSTSCHQPRKISRRSFVAKEFANSKARERILCIHDAVASLIGRCRRRADNARWHRHFIRRAT